MTPAHEPDPRPDAMFLVRVRLGLALAATAIVSLVVGLLSAAAAGSVLGFDLGGILRAVPVPSILAVVGLVLATVALTAWMSRRVLAPARELEAAHREAARMYEAARVHALEDSLTRLPNHRAFQEEFERQIESARRYGEPFSLLLVDLDDFKLVNDSAGHAIGDEVLVEMGRLLTAGIRRSDRAFRTGGDEFAVLMPHTDADGAMVVARRLLAMAVEPRQASAFSRPFSFSGGISAFGPAAATRSELFAQADAALYEAKRRGRTDVRVFDPAEVQSGLDRESIGRASALVARIVEDGALRPVYQPIVELEGGRIVGYEGLVRPTPGAGFANAGELFQAAEASGRSFDLDTACMAAVVAGAQALPADLVLSLNVSPRTLEAPEFSPTSILQLLARHGVAPGRVIVEMTEREAVEDVERLRRILGVLQQAGVRVAADDVGAGNAGLRLLSQIHFDIVKIDLSLVQAGPRRDTSLDVLRSLTDLAARWGALVIAEGVELPAQLRMLRELGVSAAQGYLLGRPADTVGGGTIDLDALVAGRPEWPESWPIRPGWSSASAGASTAALATAAGPRIAVGSVARANPA